jgi:hypothetical protein
MWGFGKSKYFIGKKALIFRIFTHLKARQAVTAFDTDLPILGFGLGILDGFDFAHHKFWIIIKKPHVPDDTKTRTKACSRGGGG